MNFPKRLIEVDLPIRRISEHARREKSIRHGHISTLHIWWARRPLAACRAVICASLWPDPADENCPESFRKKARALMIDWSNKHETLSSNETFKRRIVWQKNPKKAESNVELRKSLLDFIADFANWDNSTNQYYLETARALNQTAHEALGGEPGTRPLVVDPFAGGGAIPLEALRVGADAFASDLNPVAVLLNKVVLEYIPKYGQKLADEVRKWGIWIREQAEKELAEFYPRDPDGATPIAYLWARTIKCEGPGCGAEVPLIRFLFLAKKANRTIALQLLPNLKSKCVDFQIIVKQRDGWVDQSNPKTKLENPKFDGTVKRGSATCPCCGYTTPVARVRQQLKAVRGGANQARLMCVVLTRAKETGRFYRQPTTNDLSVIRNAEKALEQKMKTHNGPVSFLPDENLDLRGIRHTWGMIYGHVTWTDHFNRRQLLSLTTITRLVQGIAKRGNGDANLHAAVATCLALNVGKLADLANSLCPWEPVAECPRHLFSRQAVPFTWDFGEGVPIGDSSGSWQVMIERFATILAGIGSDWRQSSPKLASATAHPLPDDSANALVTDPPYYDSVPYAYLSDFFYVWLRRNLFNVHPDLFDDEVVPKDAEIVVDRPHELSSSTHNIEFYELELAKAFAEGGRVVRPDGIATIVFASKTTASWEAILKAVVDAGWIITGSWPIDTEMETRVSAQGQARLASSVHLVCRPRLTEYQNIGDWRDVLFELPKRIHDWMPRLAEEGVVGADAIFACLGPALEIFSRYSHVEKASGEKVLLKEYLEHVWGAVAKEALGMIFSGADTSGFEEDARLTAMWLWTLNAGVRGQGAVATEESQEDESTEDDDEENSTKPGKTSGFVLEFDAARKIAQGLGAHLEQLSTLIEVKGDKARLLPVSERTKALFGKDQSQSPASKKAPKMKQLSFEAILGEITKEEPDWGEKKISKVGNTVLDRLHQTMILFAAGRSEAMKRFLVEDGIGRDDRFWRLAQALSALYPSNTDEKRWVDGVLARKKSLGF